MTSNTSGFETSVPFLKGSSARVWITGLVVIVPAIYLFLQNDYGVLVTVAILGTILILSNVSRQAALLGIFAFLICLGDIRRISTLLTGPRALDTLVLVGSGFTLYFALPLLYRLRLNDPLSKTVLALMAVMTLQIFNPRQGPLIVGVSGALFTLIPVLWFWLGRHYGTDRILFLLLFRIVLPLGVACALLGIAQTFIGFFPWEEAWAKGLGQQYRLSFNGHIRPFGFSNSSVEYGTLLLITATLIIGASFAKRRAYLLLLPIVGTAMVLSAMRGPLVRVVFAGAMMWAMRGKDVRSWIPRLAFGILLGVGLLSYSARQAAGDDTGGGAGRSTSANIASARVANGLAHPFDNKYSTGGMHLQIFLEAIRMGFVNPIGNGLGATSLGVGKFGGDQSIGSSEVDISDAFVTLGFLGGLLYLGVIFLVVRRTPTFVQSGPPITRLVTVGLLTALLGSWIALGQYATAPIAWFCLGSLVCNFQKPGAQSRVARLAPTDARNQWPSRPKSFHLQKH